MCYNKQEPNTGFKGNEGKSNRTAPLTESPEGGNGHGQRSAKMVPELRTEEGGPLQGCDGRARKSATLSVNHFLPAADKVCIARCRQIWGGNTKPIRQRRFMLSSPKKQFFGEEGSFFIPVQFRYHIKFVQK